MGAHVFAVFMNLVVGLRAVRTLPYIFFPWWLAHLPSQVGARSTTLRGRLAAKITEKVDANSKGNALATEQAHKSDKAPERRVVSVVRTTPTRTALRLRSTLAEHRQVDTTQRQL